MVMVGRGRIYVMYDAGRAVRVDHKMAYAWSFRRVARTHVWHVLIVVDGQDVQRECWVLVVDLQLLQKEAAI